jgi:hypothetical protein
MHLKDTVPPLGVWLPAAFFVASGLLDAGLSIFGAGHPVDFDTAWIAAGRGLMNVVLAIGLWRRFALCRSVALMYCLGAVTAYALAILLAITHQPLTYPPTVVVGSAFEVPSCVVLFVHLRKEEAGRLFFRPLF